MARHAELIGVIFSLLAGCIAAGAAGRKWWNQRLKDRLDLYFLELNDFLDQMQHASLSECELSRETLDQIRGRVRVIRTEAFQLLADERLLPDNAFSIFQSLLAECEHTLHQRLDNRVKHRRGKRTS
ncbi:MAG: hypothetical protein AAF191_08450 [Verrucomicrobiota bacterium]